MPLKVKIFVWLCYQNRVQSLDQLKLRGFKGNDNCLLCGVEETINHILFSCVVSKFLWICFTEILSWNRNPTCIDDFQSNWLDLNGV